MTHIMNLSKRLWTLALLVICLSFTKTFADVQLPAIFSNGMVLQQQTVVHLWGKGNPGKRLRITTGWDEKHHFTMIDDKGEWHIKVSTPEAGGPYTLTFDDGSSKTLNNILIGELWLCSGQSNMEMPMKGFKNQPVENGNMDILRSRNSRIRLFTVKRTSSFTPQQDVSGTWQEATPVTVRDFSATAYYFGKLVNEVLDVPVGLIVAAWGGSACEAWMAAEWLKAFPEAKIPKSEEDIKSKNRTPTALYNGMLRPLIGIAIKGAIWYQGEDNYNRSHTYADMLTRLIEGWRAEWRQGDFPFYYCQIAPYDYALVTEKGKEVINSAYLREAQSKVEQRVPNTGMAVLLDVGMEKCIHPAKKRIAGERLALLALTKTYGVEGVNGESPYYKSIELKNDTVVISFERANMWVYSTNGSESKNFEVAGENRVFYPAKAWIERSKIMVKSEQVSHPVAVRYGFQNYVEGDIYCDGLPLSSFRSDRW